MTKAEVLEWIRRERLVPVVRAASPESAATMIDALLQGGISIVEVTMTVPGAVDLIRTLVGRFGDEVLIGAGTVLDVKTARACRDAGARFIVSPALDLGTVTVCREMGLAIMPGALTPTEIVTAWRAGADAVKVFPCDALGGPAYIKALRAPLPDVPLLPTGGVTLENVADFLRAGAIAVGVGSSLVDPKLSPAALTARAQAFVSAVR